MSKQITCKVHDNEEDKVIIKVGVEGEGVLSALNVWERIRIANENFHTFEEGKRAEVYARDRNGVKYLTSHPDGVSENNLDELKSCPI